MLSSVETNVAGGQRFRNLIRQRDIFFHDGKALRRLTLAPGAQIGAAIALFGLLLWSIFAAFQLSTENVDRRDAHLEQQVEAMEADLLALKKVAQERYSYTAEEVRKLGLDPARFDGQGGPFEAVEPLKAGNPDFKQLFMSWKKLDKLEQGAIAIPSAMPVTGTKFTSGYGVRSDPFQRRAAMHAGVDLAGPVGTEIYATADGIIKRSQVVSGYGNLVEIDHGRGIQTRYGHLSKLLVRPGQPVKRGQLVGLMGSTGRSTGSHLHYEVRIDGKAVNPIPFMQGNDYLVALQDRLAGVSKVAMGGPAEGAR
jgi:murein DD-endopeptidase MepM/ murein hydrolase activator NlpD